MFSKFFSKLEFRLTRTKRNRSWLLITYFLRELAGRLSGFFLPLFIYQVAQDNFDFADNLYTPVQKAMVLIAVYYLLQRVVTATFSITLAKLVLLFGHKRIMFWGNVSYVLYLASLFFAQAYPTLLFSAAFFGGLHNVLFWQSYNTLISYNSPAPSMGKSLGLFRFAKNIIAVLTPAAAGLIIGFFGFDYLFLVSILVALVGLVTISHLEVEPEKDEVNFTEYFSWLKEKSFDRLFLSQAGRYFYDISLVLWPLYVFLLIGDVEKVGFLYSLSLFLSMVISLFVGGLLDKKGGSKKPFFLSGALMTTVWVMRIWVQVVWSIVIVDLFDKVVGSFHWLFFDRILFNRSKGSQAYSYFVYRQTNRSIAAVIFWLILLGFFLVVPIGWRGLFVMSACGILLSLLVKEKIRDS